MRDAEHATRGELVAWRDKCAAATADVEQLRARLERRGGSGGGGGDDDNDSDIDGHELASGGGDADAVRRRVCAECESLRAQLRSANADLNAVAAARDAVSLAVAEARRVHSAETAELVARAATLEADVVSLVAERDTMIPREVHEEALQELSALRALGYNIIDNGSADGLQKGDDHPQQQQQEQHQQQQQQQQQQQHQKQQTIEELLTGKCRRLESELARTRVALQEAEESLTAQRTRGESLAAKAAEQAVLIASLEEQVMSASANRPQRSGGADDDLEGIMGGGGGGSVAQTGMMATGTPVRHAPSNDATAVDSAATSSGTPSSSGQANNNNNNHSSSTSSNATSAFASSSSSSPRGGESMPAPSDGGTGMLQIVSQQRDRFRERITALEDEKREVQVECSTLSDQLKVLRADNLSLFEKIRYLESYQVTADGAGGGGGSRRGRSVEPSATEDKYREIYEESVNPFTEFSKRERQRQYGNLNPAERLTLTGSRLLLSTKLARTGLFVYSVVLHCLVFFTLFHTQRETHALGVCPPVAHGGIAPHSTAINPFAGAGRHPRVAAIPLSTEALEVRSRIAAERAAAAAVDEERGKGKESDVAGSASAETREGSAAPRGTSSS
jgi:hypothetical protein